MHESQGICKVVGLEDRVFSGETRSYYVLKPIENKISTVYLPESTIRESNNIKPVLTIGEVEEIFENMDAVESVWVEEMSKRKAKFRKILANNKRAELIALVKSVYLKKLELENDGKKIHAYDEQYMKDAEAILYSEFSHVMDLEVDEVERLVKEKFQA